MTGKAVTVGDLAWSRLPTFRRRVTAAQKRIEEALASGDVIGVSFSGGKDSTVTLHLVRCLCPDAPAAFYDSGAEYTDTYEMVKTYGVDTIKPRYSFPQMCAEGGYWGYKGPLNQRIRSNFTRFLITEPAEMFVRRYDLDVIAMGLRGEESAVRRILHRSKGAFYENATTGVRHLLPLVDWTVDDVWAYIASHDLRYHRAYDLMTALGVPRIEQRVSTLLDATAAGLGRFSRLRQVDPEMYARIVGLFPDIARYT